MTVDVERINIANAKITANVDAEAFEAKLNEIAKKELKGVRLDGFRAGKAPAKLLRKKFAKQLDESTQQNFVQDFIEEGLKQMGVSREDIMGEPTFEDFKFEDRKLDVKITLALKPVFAVEGYAECVPEITLEAVEDKVVDERLEKVALSYTDPVEVSDRKDAQDKDFVDIDFKGFIDEKAFDGGEAKGHLLELGSKSFIDNFEEQIIGMQVGDQKDIVVKFPDDYQAEQLKGKEAKFEVKLNAIKTKTLSIDDALALKILGEQEDKKTPSVDDLKSEIKKTIEKEKKDEQYGAIKKDFFDKLIERFSDFALPENIVEQELIAMTKEKINGMSEAEVEPLKTDASKVDAIKDELRGDAKDRVRLTFLIEAIAKQEDVVVSDQQVMQEIYIEALQSGQDPKALYETYQKHNILPALKMALIEDKVVNKIFDQKIAA